jgi:hypothetical protein
MAKHSSKNSDPPTAPSPPQGKRETVNPMALSVEQVSRLLSAAGGKRITPEQVQADIDAGAPVGRDGMINLVHYAAWLVREVQAR